MMKILGRWIAAALDHPRPVFVAVLLASLALSAFLPRLGLSTDGRALLPPDHSALRRQADADRTFGDSDVIVAAITSAAPEGLFRPDALNTLVALVRELETLPGVDASGIRSLVTTPVPTHTEKGLVVQPLLSETIETAVQARVVGGQAAATPELNGVLISADGRSAAVYLPVVPRLPRHGIYLSVRAVCRKYEARAAQQASLKIRILGPAVAESLLGSHILGDLLFLLPLTTIAICLLLWLWFRRLTVVAAGILQVVSVTLWTFGLMGLTNSEISLVTVVMPVILAVYCVADTIHIAQRFSLKCRTDPARSRRDSLRAALDETLRPIVFTSATTASAFLAFALSPIPPLREFGLFTAFGILAALLLSLFAVPPFLLHAGFRCSASPARLHCSLERALTAQVRWAVRRSRLVGLAGGLLTLILAAGAARIHIQDSWIDNFSRSSPLVSADRWFNQHFYGSNILNAVIRCRASDAYHPEFLRTVAALQQRLKEMPEIGGTRSLADQMEAAGNTLRGERRLPGSWQEGRQWGLLLASVSASLTEPYVDPSAQTVNLWIFLNQADYLRTQSVQRAVDRFALGAGREQFAGVEFSGDAALGHALVGSISRSQVTSLAAASLIIFLAVLWMTRSLPVALLILLPVASAVFVNFGLMGWAAIPLGVATSTFSAIALGVGVDFALHWISKFDLALSGGGDWEQSIQEASGSSGAAILVHGIILSAGFAVLTMSAVPPTRMLGLLMGINLLACLSATLVLLPVVIAALGRRGKVRWARWFQGASPVGAGAGRSL